MKAKHFVIILTVFILAPVSYILLREAKYRVTAKDEKKAIPVTDTLKDTISTKVH